MQFLIVVAALIVAFLVVKQLVKKQKDQEATSPTTGTLLPIGSGDPSETTKPGDTAVPVEEAAIEFTTEATLEEKPKRKKAAAKKEAAAPKMSAKKKTSKQSK